MAPELHRKKCMRILAMVMLGLGLPAETAHAAPVLQRLGITPPPKSQGDSWKEMRPRGPVGRGLGETIHMLKTQPYTTRKVLFTDAERNASAYDIITNQYKDAQLAGSSEQKRIGQILKQLGRTSKSELGVQAPMTRQFAVLQGGAAADPNAMAITNGSIVVHKSLIDLADNVAKAAAAAKNPREMLVNMLAVADGKFTAPAGLDAHRVKQLSDGFLAAALGHEMTHALKFHASEGEPGVFMPLVGETKMPSAIPVREHVADLGGSDLATRAGFSTMGQALVPLYTTVMDIIAKNLKSDDSDHPPGLTRYSSFYQYLDMRKDTGRRLYDGKTPFRLGKKFMNKQDQAEFAALPTPEDLTKVAQSLLSK
jgi:hypothetical protein